MLIYNLVVLGALATLAVVVASDNEVAKQTTQRMIATAVPDFGALYMRGCPCYHQDDVDAFLDFAATADYCGFSESELGSFSLTANDLSADEINMYQYFSFDSYSGSDAYCSSSSSYDDYGTGPVELNGYGYGSTSNSATLIEPYTAACRSLLEATKSEMLALGCAISPCPRKCVNGDCGADRCECYPGWTGDSCEECDEDMCMNGECTDDAGCVCNPGWDPWSSPPCSICLQGWSGDDCEVCNCGNGVCTEYGGCQCDPNFEYPDCTVCVVGWTGENCDVCDPEMCVNGVCTDAGCKCDPGWDQMSWPPCSYCVYGWTGDNCDVCDENACMNGVCSATDGCVCNDQWTGPTCDICPIGWMWVDGTCNTCGTGWVGDNCDTCDPEVCGDGFCDSCLHGVCTGAAGCICDDDWFGKNCNRMYDQGCPCFNADDVDTFFIFAENALPNGWCEYSEGEDYVALYAYFNSGKSYDIRVTDSECSSFRTYGAAVKINADESSACLAVIQDTDASTEMKDIGCSLYGGAPRPIEGDTTQTMSPTVLR